MAAVRTLLNRFLVGLAGLPLAVAALPMALLGAAVPAAGRQVRLASRVTAVPLEVRRAGPGRVVGHTVVVFLPALISLLAALMMVYLVGAAFLYPLRPDAISTIGHPFTPDHALDGSWGGTTLVGAWIAHSAVGLGLEVASVLVLWVSSALQVRVTRRLLAVGASDRVGAIGASERLGGSDRVGAADLVRGTDR